MTMNSTNIEFTRICSHYNQIGQGALSVTWFNFNYIMDKQSHAQKSVDQITSPFLNFNGSTLKFGNG